jgi:hypothetical protein
MKKLLTLCAFMAFAGAQTVQADILYDCEIKITKRQRGWIPERLHIVIQDNGTVQVLDGILIAYGQSPKTARVSQHGNILVAHWTLESPSAIEVKNAGDYKYALRLRSSDGRITVSAVPAGDPDNALRVTGKGNCTPVSG